jgi:cellulose synthase/poly-beta-1,6-N-acetylglucosamine synthase-like glycosyltransferase
MNPEYVAIAACALALTAQTLFSLSLMLYTWERPERLRAAAGPTRFLPPKLGFTVLLPAREEQAVIAETIRRMWRARYPAYLLEILVICQADDSGTIHAAAEAIDALGSPAVRLEIYGVPPYNKPHALNVGFAASSHEIVTVFDAEDDVHPDIFNIVNTVMLEDEVGVVQAGVQLMNLRDHWFSLHNCLEYYFWFKSRLHFHARHGMIPLGGNTVFVRRDLLERVGGWDEGCLTEDADIGVRLSALGERVRVIYDAARVTREETPATTSAFLRQRTRWHQGFLQVLRKGEWQRLPGLRQRLLAFYTFSYPAVQVPLIALWPVAILGGFLVNTPIAVAMLTYAPMYVLLLQFLASLVGARLFTREYGLRLPIRTFALAVITFLPYQWLLGLASARAAYREMEIREDWEKAAHVGAHRVREEARG